MNYLVPEKYQDPLCALSAWGFTCEYISGDGIIIYGKHSIENPSLFDLEYEAPVKGDRIKLIKDSVKTIFELYQLD